jgi:hypothetical protein
VSWMSGEVVENSAEARAFVLCRPQRRHRGAISASSRWFETWSAPRRPGTWQVLGNGFIF